MKKFLAPLRPFLGRFLMALALLLALAAGVDSASAQTDMASTVSTLSGYWDAAQVVGISIIVFVVGRKIVKKI